MAPEEAMDLHRLVMIMPLTVPWPNFFLNAPDQTEFALQVMIPGQAFLPDFLLLPEVAPPPGLPKGAEEMITL
jgi:hypothetical protein